MAAKKDKMIPSEKERKRALKYATPAGTGRMWVTMGIAFIIFGIILLLIPIGLAISEASAQRYDPESIHTATLVFYLLGAFFGFCGCFCVIFGKLAVKAFAEILCKGEINYPVAEYKTPKKLLLQEAAAINQSPNAPLTASTFGNWIDFEADWQNCLSIHNGILQSHQIFKKLILVQDNFTYKELDYENNSELGVGVKTFAAGSTTTIIVAAMNDVPAIYIEKFMDVFYSGLTTNEAEHYAITLRDELLRENRVKRGTQYARFAFFRTANRLNQYYKTATGQRVAKRVNNGDFPYNVYDANGGIVKPETKKTKKAV